MKIEGQSLESASKINWSHGWYVVVGCLGLALVIIGAIAWKGEGTLVALKECSILIPASMTTVGFVMAVASCALGLEVAKSRFRVNDTSKQSQSPVTPPSAPVEPKRGVIIEAPKKPTNQELENEVRQKAMQSYGFKICELIEAIKASLPDDIELLRDPKFHFEEALDRKDLKDPHFIFGLFTCEKLLKKGFSNPRLLANQQTIEKHIHYLSHLPLEEVNCSDFDDYLKQKKELKEIYETLLNLQLQPKSVACVLMGPDEEGYEERVFPYFEDLCRELDCDPQGSSMEIAKKIISSSKLLEKEFFRNLFYNNLFVPYQIIMKSKNLSKVKEVFVLIAKEVLDKPRTPQTAICAEIFTAMNQLFKI